MMTKQLNKQLINSWEWLDAFCLTQRGNCDLACGQHGIIVVQIDEFDRLRENIGEERTAEVLENLKKQMVDYALEDTLVAQYNDHTYAVILHYLASREEIQEMAEEIRETIKEEAKGWRDPITVSIGASECHHDPKEGYKCATELSMQALKEAKLTGDKVVVAPDILPHHPLSMPHAACSR